MSESEQCPVDRTSMEGRPKEQQVDLRDDDVDEVVLQTVGVVFDGGLCCSDPAERWSAYAAGALGDELRGGDPVEGLATLPEDQWESVQARAVVAVAGALWILLNAVQERGEPALLLLTEEQTASLHEAAALIEAMGRTVWTQLEPSA